MPASQSPGRRAHNTVRVTFNEDELARTLPHGISRYTEVFARAWREALREAEPLNFPDWADKHYFLPPGSSGFPGPWETFPFQRGIMLVMGHDGIPWVVLRKPARVGYTKMLSAYMAYRIEHQKRNVAIWQPTDGAALEFAQDEINPLLEYVPVLAQASLANLNNPKDPRNKHDRKEFKAATLHIKGGRSADNYRRITVDDVILDELDAFDRNVRASDGKYEGSPVDLAKVRNTDSMFRKTILGSTPTETGMSMIDEELGLCAQVLEFHVPCPHCGHAQTLQWGEPGNDTPGIKWKKGDIDSVHYLCVRCTKPFRWHDMVEQSRDGVWASREMWLDTSRDGTFHSVANDQEVKAPESVGFAYSTLISPLFTWRDMLNEFLRAQETLKAGDKEKMRTWVNTRRGETFQEIAIERMDHNVMLTRCEKYNAPVPLPVSVLTAAVDIQGNRVELEFKGWGPGEESWGIQVIRILGDTSVFPDLEEDGKTWAAGWTDNVWVKLDAALRRQFKHEAGGVMGATVVFIDSGHQAQNVYKFCKRDGVFYIPVKGQQDGPVFTPRTKFTTDGVLLTLVGQNNCMDMLYQRYMIGLDEDPSISRHGKCHWPADRPMEYNAEYFEQMTVEHREKRVRHGRPYMTWITPPNKPNEISDLQKYNLAAIQFAQVFKGVQLGVREAFYAGNAEANEDLSTVRARYSQMAQSLNG